MWFFPGLGFNPTSGPGVVKALVLQPSICLRHHAFRGIGPPEFAGVAFPPKAHISPSGIITDADILRLIQAVDKTKPIT